MASRGSHQTTSDGTDYNSREKIATHYAASATGKSRLRLLLGLHYLLGAGHIARLLPGLLGLLGVAGGLPLPPTPTPSPQEYLWLASLPLTLLAISAIRRSNSSQLKVFQYLLVATCLLPILLTLYQLAPEALAALGGAEGAEVLGVAFAPAWCAFLASCLLVHVLQLVVVRGCLQAWAPRHGKRH